MPAKETQRSRPAMLGGLLAVLALVAAYMWWPAASPAPAPSNPAREQRTAAGSTTPTPSQLEVRLEDLQHAPPQPAGEDRNPFRFYVKPPPPPPPVVTPKPVPQPQPGDKDYVPPPPPLPPPPPPIPVKFIGTVEKAGKKHAIFTDGRGVPVWAAEGEMVMGQWRLVRIGIESVVMEYPNGTGRQTIPMRGQ